MKLLNLNVRDLFWFVVVVAMGLGWWREYRARYETEKMVRFFKRIGVFDLEAQYKSVRGD